MTHQSMGPGQVHLEFTVDVDRDLYDTDRLYVDAGQMLEDVARRAINGLKGCRVLATEVGCPVWWEQTTLDVDTDLL